MKVRLLNAVAVATTLLGAQALAQQSESGLERALADLNNGYVAPGGGNVSANASTSLNISGDIRVRNTWFNPAGFILPNGAASDQKNIDARVNMNFAFDVMEGSTVMVTLNAAENWGTAGGLGNVATGEGAFPGSTNLTTGVVNQGYFTAYDLFGDGGEFKLGRSYYTLGSGRILATDDWNQTPDSYSGIWYHNSYEDVNFELLFINDVFSGAGLNGSVTPGGDVDLYGLTVDFTFDSIDFLGALTVNPYILRSSIQASPVNPLIGLPAKGGAKNWYGINVKGSAMEDALSYDVESVWVSSNATGAPGTGSFNAWALDIDLNLEQVLGEMPAEINPVLELGASGSNNFGVTINPAYHNVAGLYDVLGTAGAYGAGLAGGKVPGPPVAFVGAATGGGVWNGLADVYQGALRIEPVEDWFGRVALVHFKDNTAKTILPGNATEIDLSVTHTLTPAGVQMYVGWARVDFQGVSPNAYIIYGVLSLPF